MSIYVSKFSSDKNKLNIYQRKNQQKCFKNKMIQFQKEENKSKNTKKSHKIQQIKNSMSKSKSLNKNIKIAKSAQLLVFFDSFDKENQIIKQNQKKQTSKNDSIKNKNDGFSFHSIKKQNPHHYLQVYQEYPSIQSNKKQSKKTILQNYHLNNINSSKSLQYEQKRKSFYSLSEQPKLQVCPIITDYFNNPSNNILDKNQKIEKYDSRKYDWRLSKSKSKQKNQQKERMFVFGSSSQKKLQSHFNSFSFKAAQQKKLKLKDQNNLKINQKNSLQDLKKSQKQKKSQIKKIYQKKKLSLSNSKQKQRIKQKKQNRILKITINQQTQKKKQQIVSQRKRNYDSSSNCTNNAIDKLLYTFGCNKNI